MLFLTCTRVPNLGSLGLRVSELEGIRLKKKYCPLGHNFDPSGLIRRMADNSDQGASDLKVWAPGHFPFGLQP